MLSQRVLHLSESITVAISSLAKELKASGKDILSFSAGEPDFDTPEAVKKAAIKAVESGFSKYTAVSGTPEVLKAVADKLLRDNAVNYKPSDIVINVGAKHSLFSLFQAVIDHEDEAVIPSPYWVTYPEVVGYCGGKSVFLPTDDSTDFKITPEQLKNAITPKTKIFILNNPSNPTGSVYSKEELEALANVLKGTSVLVVADEIYEKLLFGDLKFTSFASLSQDAYQRTITVNGLSKSAAMTGWRFGYLATPNKEIINAVKKLQSQSVSNITSIIQKAAIPALDGTIDKDIELMRKTFEKRRDLAVNALNGIEGISVVVPNGAFYIFANIKELSNDSMKFCKELLEDVGVAVVPGIGFGMDGYFRFSYAADEASIIEGIKRIASFVEKKYRK
ncbi:MAG: pyridoxal phosphate-dependent aminotransferase [Campylobacteraceae bacterium]|jgi:aspartate aminotransferase|nr:pyridoxal phosphate-dependent aminotransferase [Campylobacteraceae bacterium]